MSDPGPLPAASSLGIDVVDLRGPRALRGLPRGRTVERVLSPRERENVRSARNPPQRFWEHWAAKEAAFKAVTLVRGAPPVFAHAAFEVDSRAGRVRFGEIEMELTLNRMPARLVAVVRIDPGPGIPPPVWGAAAVDVIHEAFGRLDVEDLRRRNFTEVEADAVHSLPSALVRLAVRREAAHVLGISEDRLQVICPPGAAGRRPPYLHVDGRPVEDPGVSVSHDEGWVAWAVGGRRRGTTGAATPLDQGR